MGNQTADGRAYRQGEVLSAALSPAAPLTASGTSSGFEVADHGTLRLTQTVTAASGTSPTLTTDVQTSKDNGVTDSWRTVASFTQKTGVTSERKCFAGCDHFVRLNHTVGGTTPSFTVTYTGSAV